MSIQVDDLRTAATYGYLGYIGDGDAGPCVVCGRPVKDSPATKYVHVHEGGAVIVTEEEAQRLNDAGKEGGDMCAQPIGPDCLKRNPEVAPYVVGSKALTFYIAYTDPNGLTDSDIFYATSKANAIKQFRAQYPEDNTIDLVEVNAK